MTGPCYAVPANRSGRSGPYVGCGGSAIRNPDGALLTDAGGAEPALAVGRAEFGISYVSVLEPHMAEFAKVIALLK